MSTVDNRVVQMDFDNKQFESGVQTSLKTIDSLKKGLNFDAQARALTNLANAGRSFSLAGIADGVGAISNRFSALGIMGFTVLQRLTNDAINLGTKMVNSMAIEPLKQGLQEYETQMNAIQTIMANTASKGTTMDQVIGALDELNTYSDKTIYNFTEMARNIGTFTAAGVGLEDSVAAIKGIANLAAVSGSNSQQAATAMYQLSQALASGTVKLMDWNSVVNAGMGGQVFQDALKETARVHGVAIDDMITKEGSFRETLKDGWLTSDILLETLSKFTGDLTTEQLQAMGYTEEQIKQIQELGQRANDAATKVKTFSQLTQTLQEAVQSGWAKSWQIVVGDFEEAKAFFTDLSDTFGALVSESADARNNLLQGWKDLGGRTLAVSAIKNAITGLINILKLARTGWEEIFPAVTAQQLLDVTAKIYKLSTAFLLTSDNAKNIKATFKGIAALLDIARMGFEAVGKAIWSVVKPLLPAGSGILSFTGNLGDSIVKMRDAIKANDSFGKVIQKIKDYYDIASAHIFVFGERVREVMANVKEHLENAKETARTFWEKFKALFVDGFKKTSIDTSGFGKFVDNLRKQFQPLKKIGEFVSWVMGGIGKAINALGPFLLNLASGAGKVFGVISNGLSKGMQNFDFKTLFGFLNAGLITGLVLSIKDFFKSGSGVFGGIKDILSGVSGILNEVRSSLELWQTNLKAEILKKLAISLAILAVSIIAISFVDPSRLGSALMAMGVMFAQLAATMAIMDKIPNKSTKDTAATVTGMVGLAAALLIMAGALTVLGKLSPNQLIKGMLAIEMLVGTLVVVSQNLGKNSKGMAKAAIGLMLFAVALRMMVWSVEALGAIDPKKLEQGLIGVGVLIGEVAAFMVITSKSSMGLGKGLGILALAGALLIFSQVVETFGKLDPKALEQGLKGLGIVLAATAAFVLATGDSKKVVATAIGMVILASAMLIFSEAIGRMGAMPWQQLGLGLAGLAGALLIIAGAIRLMPKNMLGTGIGLALIAGSILILANALSVMGKMSWDQLAVGLVALGGSLLILSLAMRSMSGSIGGAAAMLVMAAALAIFTPVLQSLGKMPMDEIGRALLTLAGAFAVIGLAGLILGPLVPVLLGLSGSMMLFGLACLAVGAGVLLFSMGLAALAISGTAASAAIVLILTSLIGLIPMLATQLAAGILLFAQTLLEGIPGLIVAITTIIVALLAAIVALTPNLVAALVTLLMGFLQAVLIVVPAYVEGALFLIASILQGIATQIPAIVQAGFDILLGFLKGVRDNIGEVVTVAIDIVLEFMGAVAKKIPDIIQSGIDMLVAFIDGLTQGIKNNRERINKSFADLAKEVINGFIAGLTSGAGAVGDAIINLANIALAALKKALGIKSPSREFKILGDYATQGLVNGLLANASGVRSAVAGLGDDAVSLLRTSIEKINDALTGEVDLNPTIRPVVDLSDVSAKGRLVGDMLGGKTINVSASARALPNLTGGSRVVTDGATPVAQSAGGTAISFVQNNYSPTALSNADIYRQTRNQLSRMKGLIGAT